jgi:hypothetical protein
MLKCWEEKSGWKIMPANNGNASGATFFFTIPAHPVKETNHVNQVVPPEKQQKIKPEN